MWSYFLEIRLYVQHNITYRKQPKFIGVWAKRIWRNIAGLKIIEYNKPLSFLQSTSVHRQKISGIVIQIHSYTFFTSLPIVFIWGSDFFVALQTAPFRQYLHMFHWQWLLIMLQNSHIQCTLSERRFAFSTSFWLFSIRNTERTMKR